MRDGEDRARAHHARLEGDHERAVGEAPVAGGLGRRAQREHLGVRGGVARELALVAARGDAPGRPVDHDRADRHVARRGRLSGLGEREAHPLAVHRHAPRATPFARHPQTRLEPMRVHVADHPLITHKLTVLRDVNTPSPSSVRSSKSS